MSHAYADLLAGLVLVLAWCLSRGATRYIVEELSMPSREMEMRRSRAPMPSCHERCEDMRGNRYIVAIWRSSDGITYTLLDGTRVAAVDEGVFQLPSGKLIRRCEEEPFAHWP